jgi:single-strand DNA-binding protein
MYETPITVIGNIVDDVSLQTTDTGISRLSFRLASTARRKDRETGEWVDGNKLFLKVTFWREFAENVAASMKKGDPIIVYGKISSRQYLKEETLHYSYEIEADNIGHDLTRGVSRFDKRKRTQSGSVEVDPDGLPVRAESDGYEVLGSGADFTTPADPASRALISTG